MKRIPSNNRNGGFSLVEMLAAVAILVILLGISAVAAAHYKNYLKITELDNAAREIYLAAENRAALLNGSRRLVKLVSKSGNSVSGVDAGTGGRYISCSDIKNGDGELLPTGSIDPALLNGDFYIVYEPVSGCVTDVFYAESDIAYTEGSFQAFYTEWKSKPMDARMRRSPMLGYYGGGKADGSSTDRLHTPGVTVLIHNEEELWVEVAFLIPDGAADVDKTVILNYNGSSVNLMSPEYNSRLRETADQNSNTYAWTLDSLKCGKNGEPFSFSGLTGLTGGLGGDFTVTASVEVAADGKRPAKAEASDTDNSLFAGGSGGGAARIMYLRHLQNLDSGFSKVADSFTRAEQQAGISCYSNETYKNFEAFKPIDNSNLKVYDGGQKEIRDLYVEAEGGAGLFAKTSQDTRLTGIRLVNASVKGTSAAGAVVGGAGINTVLDDCWVYWEPTDTSSYTDLLGSNAEGGAYRYQIIGATAGGLAGTLGENSLITNCLSATLISGSDIAGGLAGSAAASLTVSNSYADCYLTGKSSAGLVGNGSSVTLTDCYAAGFINMSGSAKAAGLCMGGGLKAQASHVYSVMHPVGLTDQTEFWYLTQSQATANNDTFTDTYYLNLSIPDQGISQYGRPYDEMKDKRFVTAMGGAFAEKSSTDSHPYNLREDLQLTNYDFPGLKGLPHYGDWTAQFKEPSLVYYEKYSDGAYGFSGGNARTLVKSLEDDKTIQLDGYAVALLGTDLDGVRNDDGSLSAGAARSVTITYSYLDKAAKAIRTTPAQTVPRADWIRAEGKTEGDTVSKEYYLIPLPAAIPAEASADFYQYLGFALTADCTPPISASGDYFYNPHFAETVNPVSAQDKPVLGWNETTISDYAGKLIAKNYRQADLRTPRHLYELSRNPEYYHSGNDYRFQQRLDLDYRTYTEYGGGSLAAETFRQDPIGRLAAPFLGTYNGSCHTIRNVAFQAETVVCAGLFGCSEGKLNSIVYHMPEVGLTAARRWDTLYLGSLVGWNDGGTVTNCAASGLKLDARSTYAPFYIGGLVGQNTGIIQDCGVEAPLLSVSGIGFGTSYAGGLAGWNTGWIGTSYAVARIDGETDQTSFVWTGGFVGLNGGTVTNSYAAAHMNSSGVNAKASGFCGQSGASGSQSGACYLNMGNFTYRETPYTAAYKDGTTASGKTYAELSAETPVIPGMKKLSGTGEYPYPTAVTDAAGNPVYPGGDWPKPIDLGEMGIYYWEKLEIGGEAYYSTSLLTVNPVEKAIVKHNTLSTAHNDDGIVTEYGYGCYAADGVERAVTVTAGNINYFSGGQGGAFTQNRPQTDAEEAADQALQALMPGFTFHSYLSLDLDKSVGGLYPSATTGRPNGTLRLTQTGASSTLSVTFTLNPFFADAMSVTQLPRDWSCTAPTAAPGGKDNVYGVRAIEQLQFINWNGTTMNTKTVLTRDNCSQFPYLSGEEMTETYYWTQSHDIMGESGKDKDGNDVYQTYTPIAEYYDATAGSQGSLNGWFGGVYDGGSYVIENVSIKGQESSCAGLFGVVYNGQLSNIVLYSSDGQGTVSSIAGNSTKDTDSCWYAIGALAGLAASDTASAVKNCAVAGYTIEVNVKLSNSSWGGAEIGGLVGISNMNLEGCAAVTSIQVSTGNVSSAFGNDNVRIGGLVGASQKSIESCYAGGSIQVGNSIKNVAGIYVGGIVGGSYFKPLDPAGGIRIGIVGTDTNKPLNQQQNTTNNELHNCYSYVSLPGKSGNIKSLYALGGTGEIVGAGTGSYNDAANHGICTITNSYYLNSVRPPDTSGIKTDVNGTPGVTALSYEELETGGVARLNSGVTGTQRRFSKVTTEITLPGGGSYSVPGKYSYPPSSWGELQGMDYPFPTILSRTDGGQPRNVHYGRWPLKGITRSEGSKPMELDLFVGGGTLEEILELTGDVATGGVWTVRIEGDNPIAELQALGGQTIQDGVLIFTDNRTRQLSVKIAATPPRVNEGEVIDLSSVGGTTTLSVTYTEPGGTSYKRVFTVRVTAELKLKPAQAVLFTNGTVVLTPAVVNRLDEDLNGVLKLTNVRSGDTVQAKGANYDEGGVNTFSAIQLTGGTAPTVAPEVISVTSLFTYNGQTYAATSAVLAEVLPVETRVVEGTDAGTYTVYFDFAVVGGRKVTEFKAALAQGQNQTGVELGEAESETSLRLTLAGPPEPARDIRLKISLKLDGQPHEFEATVTAPPAPDG